MATSAPDIAEPSWQTPLIHYMIGIIYCAVMFVTYRGLSTFWTYIGFAFQPLYSGLYVTIAASAVPMLFLPSHPTSMRALAAWVLTFTLFLPALLIPQLQGWIPEVDRWRLFGVVLVCASLFNRFIGRNVLMLPTIRVSASFFWPSLIGAWFVMHMAIVVFFGTKLSLASVDQVYEQRASSSAAVGGAVLISYVLSNVSGALNPFLLAAGFTERRWGLLTLGIIGQFIVYAALAGKIVIVFIAVVLGSFVLFDRYGNLRPLRFALGMLVIAILGALTFPLYRPGAGAGNDIYDLIFVRTLYLPGVLVGAYYSFFAVFPVTYFSHMALGRLFVSYPYGSQSVGQVIGYYVTPTNVAAVNNYNANFIAADGVTALGLAGIPVVFVAVFFMLRGIDGATSRVDLRVRCAALFPFIMWLSDGSLFTAVITGGGALITMLLWLYAGVTTREESSLLPARASDRR